MTLTQILQKIKAAFYTRAEADALLLGKSSTSHNHDSVYLGINAKASSASSADSAVYAGNGVESYGGDWIRFGDGTQICWGFANALMQYGSPMSYWVYPKSFNSIPRAICAVENGGYYWVSVDNVKTEMLDFAAYNSAGGGARTLGVNFIVIGRWK